MTTGNYPKVALRLSVLEDHFAICRLEHDSELPGWATEAGFSSITCTPDELSIVCRQENVPDGATREDGWRALGIEGPLDFSLVGILASVAAPLAEAGISVFAISTYDTDYVLVREEALGTAVAVLRESGHRVSDLLPGAVVRTAALDDEQFLWEMLYEAVHWEPEEPSAKPPPEEILSDPVLRRYLEDWGRVGDLAVVAQDEEDSRSIGAAWYRLFPTSEPGYGFVNAEIPDIAIAVAAERRGTGVGGELIRALIDVARSNGFKALSLSVQKSNRAAMALYEKNGFVRLRDDGDAWIMKVDLSTDQTTNNA